MKKFLAILTLMLMTTLAFAHLPEAAADGGGDSFLKEFSVYPNPSSGKITVSFSSAIGEQTVTLKVYNQLGQEVQTQSLSSFSNLSSVELNLTDLSKGMYMVELSNGKSSRVKRISLI